MIAVPRPPALEYKAIFMVRQILVAAATMALCWKSHRSGHVFCRLIIRVFAKIIVGAADGHTPRPLLLRHICNTYRRGATRLRCGEVHGLIDRVYANEDLVLLSGRG
jgi:hypothetical protein